MTTVRDALRPSTLLRADSLLPLLIIGAAILLIGSESMTKFELVAPGDQPLRDVGAEHSYALVLVAVAAIVATIATVISGSRTIAWSVATIAVVALMIFLTVDVPKVGETGSLEDAVLVLPTAESQPRDGFWAQTLATLVMVLAAGTMATLSAEQLSSSFGRDRAATGGDG